MGRGDGGGLHPLDEDGDGIWTVHDESASWWSRLSVRRKTAVGAALVVLVTAGAGATQPTGAQPTGAQPTGVQVAGITPNAPTQTDPAPTDPAPTDPAPTEPTPGRATSNTDQPAPDDATGTPTPTNTPTDPGPSASATEPTQPTENPQPTETTTPDPQPNRETRPARVIDGDTLEVDGVRVRLGLVNTAEVGEPCADEATSFTARFVTDGVVVDGYARDAYDRTVAEVFDGAGRSLNVALAGSGWADDRYLEQYRHEHPDLARRVEAAFAGAPDRGCTPQQEPTPEPGPGQESTPQPAQPGSSGCHWAYVECVPVKGDGSGRGDANDLDCGDIRHLVHLRQVGDDPYRLDGNDNDGLGCESYG